MMIIMIERVQTINIILVSESLNEKEASFFKRGGMKG